MLSKPPTRTIRSQLTRGLLFALIPLALLAWFAQGSGTPDFALQMPDDDAFQAVEPGDVFTLPSLSEIQLEDPEGFEVYRDHRPRGGGDALNPPVGVVWLRRGSLAIRFSSKGCDSGQAMINGAVHSGPVFEVLRSGEVARVEGAAGGVPLRTVPEAIPQAKR